MSGRAARLLAQLADHASADAVEARSLSRIRALLQWLPKPFDEDADPTHVTASAIVADGDGHVVLHRHRRLGLWLQPGGHVDPGEDPEDAAVREVEEETGVRAAHPSAPPIPLHVDVHEGGRGHLHLDVRYLLLAAPGTPLRPPAGESPEVEWVTYAQAEARGDASMAAAVRAARRVLGVDG